MSQNDDFWSGSQNDPYRDQPPGQSPPFGDSVFDLPPVDYQQDAPRQDPHNPGSHQQDPYRQDPYPQDPYEQEARRRKLLATGPHEFGDSWAPATDPFEQSFTPPTDGGRGRRGGRGGGGGRGFFAAFIIAAILVALAAGAYAVYSVLEDSGDLDAAPVVDDSTTTTLATTTSTTSTTLTTLPPGLNIQLQSPDFECDGTAREFGTISGAAPDEEIAFTSPQSPNLRTGQADANGELPIRWSCTPDQVGMVWELTATGVTSGLSGTVVFTGVAAGDAAPAETTTTVSAETTTTAASETTTTVAADLGELMITITENPFACDGEARAFGSISGATPNGTISFSSPQASNIRSGSADEDGVRPVRWQCNPDQAGTIWQLTATDDATGRTVVWELTGN